MRPTGCPRAVHLACRADHFRLLDIPVDLLAGALDGIIAPACVMMHAQRLRQAGVPCSFRILPAGHMVGGRQLAAGAG